MKIFVELFVKLFPALCAVFRWMFSRKPDRGTVLIVEDSQHDALLLSRALRKLHYDCEIAESAEVAQGIVKNNSFSIIFIDLRLPGMSGQALLRILSEETPHAKMVVCCGEPADLDQIPAGKPITIIRKPATVAGIEELFKVLNVK